MTSMDIRFDMDQAPWTDVDRDSVPHGRLAGIGLLRHGTSGGRASVALRIHLPDGQVVIAETTWRAFHTAARALAASPTVAEETD